MSQSNTTAKRVSCSKGELILDVLYRETGSDSDVTESLFYELNQGVHSQHIPKDGEYLVPTQSETKEENEEAVLLLWD